MGSGHILVYAFEVFVKLYIQAGYNKKDIPEKILKNNLYGLDIDDRAGQFAIISVMLKAREYDKDIFNKIDFDKLNILSIKETDTEYLQWTRSIRETDIRETIEYLIETFKNTKEIGSLLIVEDRDYKKVEDYLNKASDTVFNMLLRNNLKDVIRVARILSKKYDVVVTNPPYMPTSKMSDNGKRYLELFYKDSKTDLCTAFMETRLVDNDKYLGMINMHSWMFLLSYYEFRKKIILNKYITTMLYLGMRAFDQGDVGTIVQTTSFVIKNSTSCDKNGIYIRLVECANSEDKSNNFNNNEYIYNFMQRKASDIPNCVIGYWISDKTIKLFNNKKISNYGEPRQGMTTSDNERFLRLWYEVAISKISFNSHNLEEAKISSCKWFPYNKGGEFRKWYGNDEFVVNYLNDGFEMKKFHEELNKTSSGGRIKNQEYYFRESITWSFISIVPCFRDCKSGHIFDVAGSSLFVDKSIKSYLLGLLSSSVVVYILNILNPTMNLQANDIKQIPVKEKDEYKEKVNMIVEDCIGYSKNDWDSFETSWDFKKHPLV